MVLNNLGKLALGAAIAVSPIVVSNVYSASDEAVIGTLMKKDSSLNEQEVKKNLKSLDKDQRAKLEKDLGLSDSKKSDKKEGGNDKGLILEPTNNLDSVIGVYANAAKLDSSDAVIKSIEAKKKELYKSATIDSLDNLATKANSLKASKTAEYSAKIKEYENAKKAMTGVITNSAYRSKDGKLALYRQFLDGIQTFRKTAKTAGYNVSDAVLNSSNKLFSPDDQNTSMSISNKHNLKRGPKIPGEDVGNALIADLDALVTATQTQMNTDVNLIETDIKKYEGESKKLAEKVSAENKDKLDKLNTGLAREYALAGESIYAQLEKEIKTVKRKDVMEKLITAAIGLYEPGVKAMSTPQYERRLAELKRWQADLENNNKLPPMGPTKAIDTTKAVKDIESFAASGLSIGNTAPYVSVRNKVIVPSNTYIEFPLTGANVDLTGIGNDVELDLKVPFDSARSIAFIGDLDYRTQKTIADLRSGSRIGEMNSDEFNLRGGVEGGISKKLGVNGLSVGYKALLGLLNYNQTVERKNEPGVKRELDRTSVQTLLDLALKYSGSKNFQIGLNTGYNSVNQTKESTRGGPAGAIGTEATDYTREFSGSIPFELLLGKLNILAEPEVSLRTYSYLEDALSGRDLGYGCGGLISFDKFAVGGRGFQYPSGYRGDAFAHIAPFKAPVQFILTYGMDRLNSKTVDVKKNTENFEVGLGLLIGETLGDFYNRLKENKPKAQKQ